MSSSKLSRTSAMPFFFLFFRFYKENNVNHLSLIGLFLVLSPIRGHPFMTSTKNQVLDPPPSTWAGPPPSPLVDVHMWSMWCGRREIHVALLKQPVQWPSGLKAEIRLYDCNLFKTVLLVIYITNLYRWKISTFYSGKKDANFFAWDEDRMTSVDSNFNFLCGHPHGAW